MCGIIGIFGFKDREMMRKRALDMAARIRHRGPDWSGIYADIHAVLAHERLSIVDVEHGAQPLFDVKKKRVLAVNGEIYTHQALAGKLRKKHEWQTKSDCEVILYLYDEYKEKFLGMMDGIFAFVLYDQATKEFFAARDHLGIAPLYAAWDKDGAIHFASEMKALDPYCSKIIEFPPGHYYSSSKQDFVQWYKPAWAKAVPSAKPSTKKLRKKLEESIRRQLMSDVPYGVLISGGLDSSIIAAIAAKYRKGRIEAKGKEEAWWPRLHSFSVGLDGSPDMKHARTVAKHLGTVHHEVVFTIQEGFDAIRDVIYHLETFDTTTIRAATPMYLMARKIKSMGIKMILTGEGADEIFGGYLYFHMAPDEKEFHEETVRKLLALSKFDCLRANKAMAAWGIEARVPFLGRDFLDYAMSIKPASKMCPGKVIEKKILREACSDLLPRSILWRQKEQFSDGVGYGWIDYLKSFAERHVTDIELLHASERFKVQAPTSKEQYYYRTIFDELFKSPSAASTVPVGPTIACSTPTAIRWSKAFEAMADPSGRSVQLHEKAVKRI
jgi:asparagine synthase (glutamine-hydrolysing)